MLRCCFSCCSRMYAGEVSRVLVFRELESKVEFFLDALSTSTQFRYTRLAFVSDPKGPPQTYLRGSSPQKNHPTYIPSHEKIPDGRGKYCPPASK